MKHEHYTIFALRNLIQAVKRIPDKHCDLYMVALNEISLLEDVGRITHRERTMIVQAVGRLHRDK